MNPYAYLLSRIHSYQDSKVKHKWSFRFLSFCHIFLRVGMIPSKLWMFFLKPLFKNRFCNWFLVLWSILITILLLQILKMVYTKELFRFVVCGVFVRFAICECMFCLHLQRKILIPKFATSPHQIPIFFFQFFKKRFFKSYVELWNVNP